MDYQKIIENLDIEKFIQLLAQLNINYVKETENYFIFPTVCHNEDIESASHKLFFYKDTKLFVCYTECGTMSIFKFFKHYYETNNIEYDWYNDIYNVIINCAPSLTIEEPNNVYHKIDREKYKYHPLIKLPIYSKEVLSSFIHYYPIEWLNDGITKEAMNKFNILFAPNQNKIVIPHYDINNNLIGIRGRALNKEEVENFGKYMPLKIENTWYTHKLSLNLYGLNINKDNIKKYKIAFIGESEKFVLQLESFNMPNCGVAICGSNLNKFQIKLLIQSCAPQEIVLCLDQEEIGNSDKYFNKLKNICLKYNKYCNFSFIYDCYNLLKLKDSPTDRGEAIFKQLLERRVKV